MKIYKIPLICENLKIAGTFNHPEYTLWGNSMLLQSEKKKFLKLEFLKLVTVLGMF